MRMKLKIRTLSKIIHKISRRDYVEEYNSMEFKNVEDIGEGMLLDKKKKKKIAKHSSFLSFSFFFLQISVEFVLFFLAVLSRLLIIPLSWKVSLNEILLEFVLFLLIIFSRIKISQKLTFKCFDRS